LANICEAAGIILAFLPPYSPDFNPIEEAFAELKQWFRSNRKMQELMDMESFIRSGLRAVAKNVRSHFSKARIGVPLRESGDDNYFWD